MEKNISIVPSSQDFQPSQTSQLIVEFGNRHIAILSKNIANNLLEAFELFTYEVEQTNWQSVTDALKSYSHLFLKSFKHVTLYINFSESVIVPAQKYSPNSSEAFLHVMFGNDTEAILKTDIINIADNPFNIYRLNKNIFQYFSSVFPQVQIKHSYTKFLENGLGNGTQFNDSIKVQFYPGSMNIMVVADEKLLIMRSYLYQNAEDVIYYLLNIVQEFSLNIEKTPLIVSGLINLESKEFELIEKVFSKLSLETISGDIIFDDYITVSTAHYYTIFTNLAV